MQIVNLSFLIVVSAVLHSIWRFICFSSPTFELYCHGTGSDLVSRHHFGHSGRSVISRWITLLPDNGQD